MADKGQGDSLQGTSSPPPCANGCGFFGSASTLNMCSKCFREHVKATSAQTTPAPPTSPTPPSVGTPSIPAPTPKAPDAKLEEALASSSTPAKEPEPPARKVQKNRSRCMSCRKKVGLTGFECHCGYVFCATHRYSDQHDCDYDYQASGRQQLAKANPVVVASKLDKI